MYRFQLNPVEIGKSNHENKRRKAALQITSSQDIHTHFHMWRTLTFFKRNLLKQKQLPMK